MILIFFSQLNMGYIHYTNSHLNYCPIQKYKKMKTEQYLYNFGRKVWNWYY